MPRTKVSKTSKRNREEHSAREIQIREFQELLDKTINNMEYTCMVEISFVEAECQMILNRANSSVLKMKMGDFLKVDLDKFNDWNSEPLLSSSCSNSNNKYSTSSVASLTSSSSHMRPGKHANDEGYLTEDSGSIGGSGASTLLLEINNQMPQPQCGRTPGPLSSARARRLRRSRSACSSERSHNPIKPLLSVSNNNNRASRNKLRTPVAAARYAVSADRIDGNSTYNRTIQHSPPAAFMRWPKPGEMVVSTCGSPIVAQVMPDRIANVNIPIKNGILSLRPKKLEELKTDIIGAIDSETLHQIRTLNANLDLIVAMADKNNALK